MSQDNSDNTLPRHEQLQEMKTLGEVMINAISFEASARDFYQSLCARVSKPMRELVEELVVEEAEHYRMLNELTNHPELEEVLRERIKVPPSDHRFTDYIQLPELSDNPDDQAILQYALGREQVAMEQYQALAEVTPAGSLQDLFTFLSHEEMAHKKELEKRYYDLVYK